MEQSIRNLLVAEKGQPVSDFVLKRLALESRIKKAEKAEKLAKHFRQSIENELVHLQRNCKHENAVINDTWQGSGMYFDKTHCLDCNKQESRYNRQTTIEEEKASDKLWRTQKEDDYYEQKVPSVSRINFGKYDW